MSWISEIATSEKFKRYSQNGEEGYLGFILNKIGASDNGFLVDIGAGDGYSLSNTKYFRESRGFKSILLDGNNHGNTEVHQEWITKENIALLLDFYQCPISFDLLSIDLDGNDYWSLEALLKHWMPSLIIAEINPKFKRSESFAIKYNPEHSWQENDYYGMSLEALIRLGKRNNYETIFVNNSLNAYLLHKMQMPKMLAGELIKFEYEKKNDFKAGPGEWIEIK